ncbi:MAG: glucosyl transferase, partial [Ignavibacteriaceae bacterium]|nr:glucosyl transferase [Ignavibacteriaceae bacterium]
MKTTELPFPTSVTLTQNNQARMTINLNTADTLLYIDSLLPNQSYKFTATATKNNQQLTTNEVLATTLDTTSHNFTWQTFTFGQHSSSVLYDVAIINENNIWAVGEIYMNDSLGQPDPIAYNAVHWDGSEWKVKKIDVHFRGSLITPPLEGVFAFSSTDIWFVGSLPIHGDGTNWVMYDLRTTVDPNLSLSKAWGTSSSNIYFVGRNGSIAHYQNGIWKKIESGTTSIINDIWGIVTENNEAIAYCPVSSFWIPGDKKLLSIKGNSVDSIPWTFNRLLYSVWTPSERVIYICGGGIFERRNNQWKEINITSVAVNRVRGNYLNDIFVAGDFGFVAHFNGLTWKIEEYDFNSGFGGLSVMENLTAVVGQR